MIRGKRRRGSRRKWVVIRSGRREAKREREGGGGKENRRREKKTKMSDLIETSVVYTCLPGQSRLLATANQQRHFLPLLHSQTNDCDKRNQTLFFLESSPPVCRKTPFDQDT